MRNWSKQRTAPNAPWHRLAIMMRIQSNVRKQGRSGHELHPRHLQTYFGSFFPPNQVTQPALTVRALSAVYKTRAHVT